MNLWEELNKNAKIYYENESDENLEILIKMLVPYLKSCARNSVRSAEISGVYIPYEDFFSNYLQAIWQAIEAHKIHRKFTLKNIILRRIYIAEKTTWRSYKKYTYNSLDKEGISYKEIQHKDIEQIKETTANSITNYLDSNLYFKIVWSDYFRNDIFKGMFIFFLYSGYSSKEVCQILNISTSYNSAARKKVQRIREDFAENIK